MSDWTSLLNDLNGSALKVFGREVTYVPQTGQRVPIRAIFEATREPEDNSPGVYAAVFVRASEIAASPSRGDQVIVDATTYTVFDIEADQGGGLVLRLRQS
jgi:hypothetical protein